LCLRCGSLQNVFYKHTPRMGEEEIWARFGGGENYNMGVEGGISRKLGP
jgi:hypothetical protein